MNNRLGSVESLRRIKCHWIVVRWRVEKVKIFKARQIEKNKKKIWRFCMGPKLVKLPTEHLLGDPASFSQVVCEASNIFFESEFFEKKCIIEHFYVYCKIEVFIFVQFDLCSHLFSKLLNYCLKLNTLFVQIS